MLLWDHPKGWMAQLVPIIPERWQCRACQTTTTSMTTTTILPIITALFLPQKGMVTAWGWWLRQNDWGQRWSPRWITPTTNTTTIMTTTTIFPIITVLFLPQKGMVTAWGWWLRQVDWERRWWLRQNAGQLGMEVVTETERRTTANGGGDWDRSTGDDWDTSTGDRGGHRDRSSGD